MAYDRLLSEAAAMLDVALPPSTPQGGPFTAEQRARVEDGLAAAGLEVRTGGS